jgi:hypothetical protein
LASGRNISERWRPYFDEFDLLGIDLIILISSVSEVRDPVCPPGFLNDHIERGELVEDTRHNHVADVGNHVVPNVDYMKFGQVCISSLMIELPSDTERVECKRKVEVCQALEDWIVLRNTPHAHLREALLGGHESFLIPRSVEFFHGQIGVPKGG